MLALSVAMTLLLHLLPATVGYNGGQKAAQFSRRRGFSAAPQGWFPGGGLGRGQMEPPH
jgi:hypothetical protein